jgi:hypothetical protein
MIGICMSLYNWMTIIMSYYSKGLRDDFFQISKIYHQFQIMVFFCMAIENILN